MLRSELIEELGKKYPHLRPQDVERAVDLIFEDITEALVAGERVELRGFGAFSVRYREPRTGRNPKTGESVDVAAKKVPFFRAGKDLRARVNAGVDPEKRK